MKYTVIEYDNIKDADGWTVNNEYKLGEVCTEDIDTLSARELYKFFARYAGFKASLRAIEIIGDWDYFIEFVYTAASADYFFPLGRLERSE